ncbi:MAG: hypothetical protein O3C57_08240, partial [Verrucomicrobia bacterium]|nr:hypothetical protein [Verrucomicrobiota bacterium]
LLIAVLMRSRVELRLALHSEAQTWWVTTGLGFIILSIFLIALANPRGDVQDDFVQRVKFISSHALYALWIGYGLVFALARIETWRPASRLLRSTFVALALGIVLIPLAQNAWNSQLIARSGAAEQTQHDFGWQFGNYQLRGAASIAEELADEEPLPNPFFPPAMERDAIFFGGTDPGRFVPTYMIYSARVREDVHLITQNALADRTYLHVMRDLYGDRIWIPSSLDSERAFNIYAGEVKAGIRPPNAQLTVKDGHVKITGIMGVMEINGILARMMFDVERARHAFYVEESYPIPWMYPFLSPHGLILKLNADPADIGAELLRDDADLWDWYTRRLHGTRGFQRDVVARKSFSKLRSAIAGIYTQRGMFAAAENAFNEARLLYAYSPEASLRLVQGVHVPQKRYADAESVLRNFLRLDPGNDVAPVMLQQLINIGSAALALAELEAAYAEGTLALTERMKLAAMHLQMQSPERYQELMDKIVTDPQTPATDVFKAAMIHHSYKQYDQMETALQVFEARVTPGGVPADYRLRMANMYVDARNATAALLSLNIAVRQDPENWRAWLDIALLQQALGQTNIALLTLKQAHETGGDDARDAITQSPALIQLLQSVPRFSSHE